MTSGARKPPPGKVVYLTSLFPVITQTFVSREIRELERRGIEVLIVSLRNDPQPMEDSELPCAPVWYLPFFFSRRLWSATLGVLVRYRCRPLVEMVSVAARLARRPMRAAKFLAVFPKSLLLIKLLEEEGSFHLHAHWATVPTTCAYFIHRVTGWRFSFSAHAWDIFVTGNEILLPEKIRAADRVFTCTAYNQRYLERIGGKGKITLAYHGLDLSRYSFCPPGGSSPPLIVAGGSLVAQKGLGVLLHALSLLRDRGREFRCVVLGEGPERPALETLRRHLRLEDEVSFPGFVPHRQVARLLVDADVFVMSSVQARGGFIDGLPNVVPEAMAAGAVVVASTISGIPEIIEDGQSGLLVTPGDAKELAEAMEYILSDRRLAQTLATRARQRVIERFDIARNIEPIYRYFISLFREAGANCAE